MIAQRYSEPLFVAAILDSRAASFGARILLVGAYLEGSITKLLDFPSAIAEQAQFGMHPAATWAGVTIAVELLGSLFILTNRLVWLGAGMLGVFTALAAIKANAFWTMIGPDRFAATNGFFEHFGLVGGFILVAILDRRMARG